jgi:hypothetical protein
MDRRPEMGIKEGVTGRLNGACNHMIKGKLEARGGIEPPIKVLQTFALPLGDRAMP